MVCKRVTSINGVVASPRTNKAMHCNQKDARRTITKRFDLREQKNYIAPLTIETIIQALESGNRLAQAEMIGRLSSGNLYELYTLKRSVIDHINEAKINDTARIEREQGDM